MNSLTLRNNKKDLHCTTWDRKSTITPTKTGEQRERREKAREHRYIYGIIYNKVVVE